ncbi:hypothetical protein BDD12DRAFT_896097 [Trichophaea hybrida]|nr:hypothetical protein BDD12DRAFT_896097 [Trichophaea hybrida]
MNIKTVLGEVIQCTENAEWDLYLDGCSITQELIIMENEEEAIFGMDWLRDYGITIFFEADTITVRKKSHRKMLRILKKISERKIYRAKKEEEDSEWEESKKERSWRAEVPKRYHKYAEAFDEIRGTPETDVIFNPESVEGAVTDWKPYKEYQSPHIIQLKDEHVKKELKEG